MQLKVLQKARAGGGRCSGKPVKRWSWAASKQIFVQGKAFDPSDVQLLHAVCWVVQEGFQKVRLVAVGD